uniref:PA2169 family four-helix-bundle protein n=1 Tax=Roseihalotalea indica TaxID=2867963 RepID=A0AA49JIR3_9BACT|nr:PA2169 family four-helix-bundle protein [Tunicatimonas sp. TK19036]
MSTDHKKTIKTLHDLIQINREGERGYKEASENIDLPEFKTLLYRLSQQRALFRGELEDILHKDFKDDAIVKDSIASKAHRTWMDFKSALTGHDNKAVLDECERGEEHAIKAYGEVFDGRLPDYIEKVALNQLELIRGTLSQVREFKYEIQETH